MARFETGIDRRLFPGEMRPVADRWAKFHTCPRGLTAWISLGWGVGINGGPNSVERIPTYPLSGCASTGGRIPTYPLEDLSLVTDVTVVCNGQMSAPPARQPPSKIGAGEEMRGVADDPKVASKINFAGIRPRARSCRPAGLRNLEWPRVGVTVA